MGGWVGESKNKFLKNNSFTSFYFLGGGFKEKNKKNLKIWVSKKKRIWKTNYENFNFLSVGVFYKNKLIKIWDILQKYSGRGLGIGLKYGVRGRGGVRKK